MTRRGIVAGLIVLASWAAGAERLGAQSREEERAVEPSALQRTWRDMAYAPPPSDGAPNPNVLDFYVAPGATRAPLVIFVHGGGWRRGDKRGGQRGHPEAMVAHGFAYASINYRLRGLAPPDGAAQDVARAIAYLRGESERLRIDPERIVLIGHSAGAHLAALTALDPRYMEAAGAPRGAVRAVVLLDGAGYDIPRQIAEGARGALYREVFGDDPEYLRQMSPISHVAGPSPPAFLIHHVGGRGPSAQKSAALAAALRRAGGVAEVFVAEGETHASINRGFGETGDAVTRATFAFLDRVLGAD